MQEADRADGGGSWSRGAGLPGGGPESPEENVKDGADDPGSVMKEGPEAFGDGGMCPLIESGNCPIWSVDVH